MIIEKLCNVPGINLPAFVSVIAMGHARLRAGDTRRLGASDSPTPETLPLIIMMDLNHSEGD